MNGRIRALIGLAAVSIAVRLFAMAYLHPLNWDEVEYFRATDWVRQGLVPFRDFWEHHTPLQWFVFAPLTGLTGSPGAGAILFMRWTQLPFWIAAFWLVNRLMTRSGIDPFARWSALIVGLTSSLLMISAMEYRVDTLANVLYLGGLLLVLSEPSPRSQGEGGRRPDEGRALLAGALFCLAGFANLRLGPLLAVTVILNRLIDVRERRWGGSNRANWVFVGVIATFALGMAYFVATGSLRALYQHVWVENYVGEKYAQRVPFAFVHRILVVFGVRLYGGEEAFVLSGIELAGVALIIAGLFGLIRALREVRTPGPLFVLALLQIANLLAISRMKFVYHYHLQIAVLLMLPFVAAAVEKIVARRVVLAFLVVAVAVNVPIVLLRGKERDLAYQDRIMREVHARTQSGDKVFDGVGWAIRREPAYRFWFLPVLVRQLVMHGHASPYNSWMTDPPAAIITDRNAKVWIAMDRRLRSFVEHHYLPLWQDLWMPAMSATLRAGGRAEWVVPATGRYRIVAGPDVRRGPQFRVVPRGADLLQWTVDGRPVAGGNVIDLRKGSRVAATAVRDLSVFLVPGSETVWFRQPPEGVTIDGELPRVWHIPFSEPTPTSSARP